MTIGLPRALLYYKYQYLWEVFFSELGCRIVLSEQSNQQILSDGIRFSIDESCLPSKIYMGHVYSLIGKCDYILVPRVENFGKNEKVCVKFNGMYDIIKNTFKDIPLIYYNVDVTNGHSELKGFLQMGRMLGKSYRKSFLAYQQAKKAQALNDRQKAGEQIKRMDHQAPLKILIVTHQYNIYDNLVGTPVIKLVKESGGIPIYADACDDSECIHKSKEISKTLNWTYSKELVGAIGLYKDKVDGIILMTTFPCGPDSLVNELLLRKIKGIPMSHIVIDELSSEAGLQTRIESFMDIIKVKKELKIANE